MVQESFLGSRVRHINTPLYTASFKIVYPCDGYYVSTWLVHRVPTLFWVFLDEMNISIGTVKQIALSNVDRSHPTNCKPEQNKKADSPLSKKEILLPGWLLRWDIGLLLIWTQPRIYTISSPGPQAFGLRLNDTIGSGVSSLTAMLGLLSFHNHVSHFLIINTYTYR